MKKTNAYLYTEASYHQFVRIYKSSLTIVLLNLIFSILNKIVSTIQVSEISKNMITLKLLNQVLLDQ